MALALLSPVLMPSPTTFWVARHFDIPFSDVQEVHVRDASELVFTCRLFRTEEGNFAVASLGRGSPASDDVDRAVSLVAQVMCSTGPRVTADDQADSRQDSDRS